MPYHKIMYDNDYEGGQVIGDYVMGLIPPTVARKGVKEYEDKVFDLTVFWEGRPFDGRIPDFVKLIMKKDDEQEEQLDLLPNPVSWLIFSERLTESILPFIQKDVQIFDPPIFRESDGSRVKGYKLINPIKTIDCLDVRKSKIDRAPDGHIKFCSNIHIRESGVGEHHIFRIKDYFPPILISDKLAKYIRSHGFKGFAFLRCGVTEQRAICNITENTDDLVELSSAVAVRQYIRSAAGKVFTHSIVNTSSQIQKLVKVRAVADRERLKTHLKIAAMISLVGFVI